MSIEENGFLGEEIKKHEKSINNKNKKIFDFYYELNNFANKIFHKFSEEKYQFDVMNRKKFVSYLFYQKILRGTQAGLILLKKGLHDYYHIIQRSLVEAYAHLKLIFETDYYAKDYLNYYSKNNRKKHLNRLLNSKDKDYLDDSTLEERKTELEDLKDELEKYSKKINRNSDRLIKNSTELLQKAGVYNDIEMLRAFDNDYVHMNFSSFEEFYKLNGETLYEYTYGPINKNIKINILAISEIILKSLIIINKIHNFKVKERIGKLVLRIEKLENEVHNDN